MDQIRFSTLPNNFGAEESSKKGSLCDTVPSGSNPHQTVIKENPFRRVFAKRKQFYQRLSDQAAANRQNVSAPLWRRNCETATNKLQNQSSQIIYPNMTKTGLLKERLKNKNWIFRPNSWHSKKLFNKSCLLLVLPVLPFHRMLSRTSWRRSC